MGIVPSSIINGNNPNICIESSSRPRMKKPRALAGLWKIAASFSLCSGVQMIRPLYDVDEHVPQPFRLVLVDNLSLQVGHHG
jgi:hypothetical protein